MKIKRIEFMEEITNVHNDNKDVVGIAYRGSRNDMKTLAK